MNTVTPDLRVLITGSRDWSDGDAIRAALLTEIKPWYRDITVVHGAARGADEIAGAIARSYGWTVEEHPAPWRQMGKRAGIERNCQMVDLGADVCLAFIRNGSKGASHCADRAERAGIRVVRHETWVSRFRQQETA